MYINVYVYAYLQSHACFQPKSWTPQISEINPTVQYIQVVLWKLIYIYIVSIHTYSLILVQPLCQFTINTFTTFSYFPIFYLPFLLSLSVLESLCLAHLCTSAYLFTTTFQILFFTKFWFLFLNSLVVAVSMFFK